MTMSTQKPKPLIETAAKEKEQLYLVKLKQIYGLKKALCENTHATNDLIQAIYSKGCH